MDSHIQTGLSPSHIYDLPEGSPQVGTGLRQHNLHIQTPVEASARINISHWENNNNHNIFSSQIQSSNTLSEKVNCTSSNLLIQSMDKGKIKENLKENSNKQNFHFRTQIPAQEKSGDEEEIDNQNTLSRKADTQHDRETSSYRDSIPKESNSLGLRESKTLEVVRSTKKNGTEFMGLMLTDEDEGIQVRKDSKYLYVSSHPDQVSQKHRRSNNNCGSSTVQWKLNSSQQNGSYMQDSQNLGSKDFKDDYSEYQGTIVNTNKTVGIADIWKKRFFRIIQNVARFMNIMLVHSSTKNFSMLRREDFKIIGDIASNYEFFLYRDYFAVNRPSRYQKIMFNLSQKLKRNIGALKKIGNISVLKPYQAFKVSWDVLILLMTVVNLAVIPVICFFEAFLSASTWSTLQYQTFKIGTKTTQLFGYEDFFLDIITLVPYFLGTLGVSNYLFLPILFKAIRLSQTRKHLIEVLQPSEKILIIIRIINVFSLVLFIAHMTSSGFVWIGMRQYNSVQDRHTIQTWLSREGLLNQEWAVIYVNGLYWAIISMITIGYGDITPVTTQEKLYTITSKIITYISELFLNNLLLVCLQQVSLVSCAVFAYCINTISQIITDLKVKQKKLKERIANLNRFLQTRGLEMHLQMKVRKYIEYLQYSEESEGQAVKDLEMIPKSIKEEVQIDIYGRIISNIKLFKLNFSTEAINNLALRLNEISFGPGEIIFKSGEKSDRMFIVLTGRIELSLMLTSKGNEEIEHSITFVEKGHIFGVEEFFGQQIRQTQAKATMLSQVIEISAKNFHLALSLSSKFDLEKFQMLRDLVKFSKTTKGLGVQCFYCQSFDHSYTNCPNVMLSRNKPLCLAKYNFSQSQLARTERTRTILPKINALQDRQFLEKSINYFLHYGKLDDNNKGTDGFTEETIEMRGRNASSFSYALASQKNIARRNRHTVETPTNNNNNRMRNSSTSNVINNPQTSIKLQAVNNPSLILMEGIDLQQSNNNYNINQNNYNPIGNNVSSTLNSETMLDDRPTINLNAQNSSNNSRSFLKLMRQKSREHSNRIQRRNLTNIVEERSGMDNTNLSSLPSQFHSNLNIINSAAQAAQAAAAAAFQAASYTNTLQPLSTGFIPSRSQTNIRNLTWNGGQQQMQQQQQQLQQQQQQQQFPPGAAAYQSQKSSNKYDMSSELQEQQIPNLHSYLSPKLMVQNSYNNNYFPLSPQSVHTSSMTSTPLAQDLIARGSQGRIPPPPLPGFEGFAFRENTSSLNLFQQSQQHYSRKESMGTSNLHNISGNPNPPSSLNVNGNVVVNNNNTSIPLLPPNVNQSQSMGGNVMTQNSNYYSNSDLNGNKGHNHNGDAVIDVYSIRNVKATCNWESEYMRLFDKFRIFKQYFPYNNIDTVLKRFNGPFFLVKKRQEQNKKRLTLKKQIQLMKKKSFMLDNGSNLMKSNQQTFRKGSLPQVFSQGITKNDLGSLNMIIQAKKDNNQALYTKDKTSSNGGDLQIPNSIIINNNNNNNNNGNLNRSSIQGSSSSNYGL